MHHNFTKKLQIGSRSGKLVERHDDYELISRIVTLY